jgi:hypothetical protein
MLNNRLRLSPAEAGEPGIAGSAARIQIANTTEPTP